ncbi:fibrinogen-like protein A [Mizuhopecten yessoensis]|uniref:fibrinogen-like protein A n=1 Tax=Mizuhopecten yessoensis TaxID=6573 RepID=UPI000B45BDE1|nr:fibrinogen-like protein A [Mizuhopecten yessoensis]
MALVKLLRDAQARPNVRGAQFNNATVGGERQIATSVGISNTVPTTPEFNLNSAYQNFRTESTSQDHNNARRTNYGYAAESLPLVETFSSALRQSIITALNNCGDVPTCNGSGVYTLTPTGSNVDVFCDLDTAGGPWTIIASRYDGSVDFYKSWNEYKNGFGSLTGEFWLVFKNVRLLLVQNMKLRIEMEAWSGTLKHVEYDTFDISDEASEYILNIGGYSSPDGLYDALNHHNGRLFSTYDNGNYISGYSCTSRAHGAWWYKSCYQSNLFGKWMTNEVFQAMNWFNFYANNESHTAVKTVRMMLKKK